MAAIQLNFTLRTSAKCKTVHLVGSWDTYAGQLPLSKDTAKTGGWKGTFRFQGATLKQGQRYWYYYIIDGYHVSHDPARDSTTEPTTGRKLNILDIPSAKPTTAAEVPSSKYSRHARHASRDIAKGRSLSPSQIQSPTPSKPYATRGITNEQYNQAAMEMLTAKYASQRLSPSGSASSGSYGDSDSDSGSDLSSNVPSLSSRSSNSSSPSSVSTASCCNCERYAITRSGNRVKLDCGGHRCGYSDASSECSSSDSEEEERKRPAQGSRRQGVVIGR